MEKFFSGLVNYRLYSDWASTLDWLFDDDKFLNFDRNIMTKFTKKVKKLEYIGVDNYIYDSIKCLSFNKINRIEYKLFIALGKKDSQGRDFVRHIRNGIAHGATKIERRGGGDLYIEIKDFNSKKQQTAYIYMPLDYIVKIHQIYKEVKCSIKK